jgi:hypothetical protein
VYDGCNSEPGACGNEVSKGICIVNIDGYYPIIALCFLFGLALVPVIRAKLLPLQYGTPLLNSMRDEEKGAVSEV